MAKEAFNPIDLSGLSIEEVDTYFEALEDVMWAGGGIPRSYRGSPALYELIKNRELAIGAVIRVNRFDAGADPHYIVTADGLMDHRDSSIHSPEEALDTVDNPEWEVIGHT